MTSKKQRDVAGSVEGALRGLGGLVEKLGHLAETGERLKRSGQFEIKTEGDKDLKGVYGFTVKAGLGEEEPAVEPFGNIRRDEETGETVVREVAEPMVDVIQEADHLRVVAEMPGVGEEDVRLELEGDLLTIGTERGSKKYRKEVLLPHACDPAKMTYTCRNGILEVLLG